MAGLILGDAREKPDQASRRPLPPGTLERHVEPLYLDNRIRDETAGDDALVDLQEARDGSEDHHT